MNNGFTQQVRNNNLFANREERNRFVAEYFSDYIGSRVVNVGGGGKKHLAKYLDEDVSYIELDVDGEPDCKVDLEKDLPLDFCDEEFDTVICTEVLEHLDNFHEVFSELLRIGKLMIISLPNPVNDSLSYFMDKRYKGDDQELRNQHGKYTKYYGLPFERPNDRHKWFFSFTEAEDFFYHNQNVYNYKVVELFGTRYYGRSLIGKVVRFMVDKIMGVDARKNIFCNNIWVVLKKID